MAGGGVVNPGPRGRSRALLLGIASLTVAVVFADLAQDAALPVRLLVFLPLLGGALGLFQARDRTRVLASRGRRDTDGGCEVGDSAEAAAARMRARTVVWRSVAAAALGTLAYVIASG